MATRNRRGRPRDCSCIWGVCRASPVAPVAQKEPRGLGELPSSRPPFRSGLAAPGEQRPASGLAWVAFATKQGRVCRGRSSWHFLSFVFAFPFLRSTVRYLLLLLFNSPFASFWCVQSLVSPVALLRHGTLLLTTARSFPLPLPPRRCLRPGTL